MSETVSETSEIELPHNSWYDGETNSVSFALGPITFTLSPEEFFSFASQVDDISTVLSQMVTVEEAECPTCGAHLRALDVEPIPESEYH